jgi:hypothetical protein
MAVTIATTTGGTGTLCRVTYGITRIGITPLSELDKNTDCEPRISLTHIGVLYAAMCISRQSWILTREGKRAMTKNLALAASVTMLIAISGQAFADTAPKNVRYLPEATGLSDRQVVYAFNAFDPAMATQTAEPNAYRYHGGPKSND